MVKTLIAIAVAGAFALPLAVQASGSDNIVVAQGGDTGATNRQPGATPPGSISPGTPRSAATGADRDTGASSRANPNTRESSAAGRSSGGNFDRLDKNHDGFVSRDEANDASELNTRFSELDRNNDGKLSREEYNAVNSGASRGATGTGSSSAMGSGSSAPTGKGPGAQDSASRPLGGAGDSGGGAGGAAK
jgi:EF hand domain-containing protein